MRQLSTKKRQGFSLVELMVAMSLSLFVMLILTQAFVTSLDTFASLKSIGEMQAKLRTVTSILESDLAADHFGGKQRLSSPDLLTFPPNRGFFMIYQGSVPDPNAPTPYLDEGVETRWTPPPGITGLQSMRATNHVLYFTVKQRGNRPEDYFTATIPNPSPLQGANTNFFGQSTDGLYQQPGTFFNSQWAEVCYFLVQTGTVDSPSGRTDPNDLSTPLFALYRSQYLLVPNPTGISLPWPPAVTPFPYPNLSSYVNIAGNLAFNAPDDVAQTPGNRALLVLNSPLPYPIRPPVVDPQAALGTPPSGATLVLSNVTSFQVQVFTQLPGGVPPGPDFTDLVAPQFPAVYDTSTPGGPGYNILAVKVTIRIYDSKSTLSRQTTIIQDM